MQPLILLVEDDSSTRSGYAELLNSQGFRVAEATTASAARAAVRAQQPDLALIDVVLPDGDGLALAFELRGEFARMPVIAFTGHWSTDYARRGQQIGLFATIMKPVAPAHLLSEIYRALAGSQGAGPRPAEE